MRVWDLWVLAKSEERGVILKKYIREAYDKCIYIHNNGFEYEFYKRFDRRPTKIILGLGKDYLEYAEKNNKKYMDEKEFAELWELIDKDNKPWGFSQLPSKEEQIKITLASKK